MPTFPTGITLHSELLTGKAPHKLTSHSIQDRDRNRGYCHRHHFGPGAGPERIQAVAGHTAAGEDHHNLAGSHHRIPAGSHHRSLGFHQAPKEGGQSSDNIGWHSLMADRKMLLLV